MGTDTNALEVFMKLLSMTVFHLLFSVVSQAAVYDADKRFEVTDAEVLAEPQILQASKAVGIMIQPAQAVDVSGEFAKFAFSLKKKPKVDYCPSTRFRDQRTLGFCTVFLINNDTVATAAHCLKDVVSCEQTKLYMTFKYDYLHQDRAIDTQDGLALRTDDVYQCRNILIRQYPSEVGSTYDFAVIRLDRPVRSIKPLAVAQQNAVASDELFSITHPEGLPKKVAFGGKFLSVASYESSNPLSFFNSVAGAPGSSGGPVFNRKTLKVEGIYLSSEDQFQFNEKQNCMEEAVYNSADPKIYIPEAQFIHKVAAFAKEDKSSAIAQKTESLLSTFKKGSKISAAKHHLALIARRSQDPTIAALNSLLVKQESAIFSAYQELVEKYCGPECASLKITDTNNIDSFFVRELPWALKTASAFAMNSSPEFKEEFLNFVAEKLDPALYFMRFLNENFYFFHAVDLNKHYLPLWQKVSPLLSQQELIAWEQDSATNPLGHYFVIRDNLEKWKLENPALVLGDMNALILDMQLKNFIENYISNIKTLFTILSPRSI